MLFFLSVIRVNVCEWQCVCDVCVSLVCDVWCVMKMKAVGCRRKGGSSVSDACASVLFL